MDQRFHTLSLRQAAEVLQTDPDRGLSLWEAAH